MIVCHWMSGWVVCLVSKDCVAVIFKGLTLKMKVSQSCAHSVTHQHFSKDLNPLPADCSENLTYLNDTATCLLFCTLWMLMGNGCTSPLILHLGTRWGWAVSFLPRPLYCQGKSSWQPLNRRLVGLQTWSGCFAQNKTLLLLLGIDSLVVQLMS
jgi:hypothetical protein